MHILLADDERPARAELRYILEQLSTGATFIEAANGDEALACVAREAVDVVFLDINMPGTSGLAVAAALAERPRPPLVVFATAYDAHAVRAFELAALDYVVKPFSEQRLAQTLLRIRQALAAREQRAARLAALQRYLQQAGQPAVERLWGERENKTAVLVPYADLLWLEAVDKRVRMRTRAGETLQVRQTLHELEARLAAHGFARVHKAYLVNLQHVAEVVPWFSGTYLLRMADPAGSEIPMSRQYGRALKARLDG